jgi:protein SCO1/2
MTPQKLKLIIITCLAIIAVGIGAIVALMMNHPGGSFSAQDRGSLGVPSIGGPFALVNQDGKAVTEADYRGRFMLIYFGYTFCPDVCPTGLANIAAAIDMLPEARRGEVQPIFITIDPARDTVALMKEYVPQFHPALVGLTGTADQIAVAAKAYRVYYRKNDQTKDQENYLMDHAAVMYLMGKDGKFVTHFTHETPPEKIAEKLKQLIGG